MSTDWTLSAADASLFCEIRASLAIFAHTKLHASEASFEDLARNLFTDQWEMNALDEAWANPDIIDEFAQKQNLPFWFSVRERAIARSWRHHLSAEFIAFKRNGRVLLVRENCVFEALGITDPIGYTLENFPCTVRTTLLPFEGHIVFSGFLISPQGRPGAADSQAMELKAMMALQDGELVSSAERFAELAQPLAEKFKQEEAERSFAELESLSESAPRPAPGYHRSEYANASYEELEQIRNLRHDMDRLSKAHDDYEKRLFPSCIQGAPRFALADMLDANPSADLAALARAMRVDPVAGESATGLGLRMMRQMRENHDILLTCLGILDLEMLTALRNLYEQGGVVVLDTSAPVPVPPLPPLSLPFLCCAFREGDKVTFVMPQETRALLRTIDFNELQASSELRWGLINRAAAAACLQGIVSVDDIADSLAEPHFSLQDGDERNAFETALLMYAQGNALPCCMLVTPDDTFLLDFNLANAYLFERDERLRCMICLPEAPESLAAIRESQLEHKPRPLTPEMTNRADVRKWIGRLPAMRALRSYFDERIPDGQDDFDFTERIMSCVIAGTQNTAPNKIGAAYLIDLIDGLGMNLRDGTTAPRLHELLSNAINSTPLWALRGWAVKDTTFERNGRKVFFNDDGSVMRIGDNDPCPCGSGLAYGACCGKAM